MTYDILKDFPDVLNLPEGSYIVGGTARYLEGLDKDTPRDIDLMFPDMITLIKFLAITGSEPKVRTSGSMATCFTILTNGFRVVECWVNPAKDLEDYLERVPTNVDGVACRFGSDRQPTFYTASDYRDSFCVRTKNPIVTASNKHHVYRMMMKFATKENS